jgi:hypothetical protein
MRNLTLLVRVRDGESTRQQYERNTQHTEDGSPSRLQKPRSVFAQHISTIVAGENCNQIFLVPSSTQAQTIPQTKSKAALPSNHHHQGCPMSRLSDVG